MKVRIHLLSLVFCLSICHSCSENKTADMIIYANHIQSVDNDMTVVNALAIKDGIIVDRGSADKIIAYQQENTEIINIPEAFVMPGFIEGHGHFSGLGKSLSHLNFLKTKSWQEIVSLVEDKIVESEPGEWIYGRGWHQDKWEIAPDDAHEFYPTHKSLSLISQDNPVILFHASGHSLFANQKAMELAGVSSETPDPKGGHIVKDEYGEVVGVFEERGMNMIRAAYGNYLDGLDAQKLDDLWHKDIELAIEECLSNGITSFQDAGSSFKELDAYEQLALDGKLALRLWVMARHKSDELKDKIENYRKIDVGNGFYTCRAIKSEVDGALGSYGAWLIKPYDDKADFVGQNTTEIDEVKAIAQIAKDAEMQLCVHAIGDRANREVLDIIEAYTETPYLRWRIEHAQHLDPDDIPRFNEMGVIASMQGVHCTSDAPFVTTRLGEIRAKQGAYVWKSLIDSGAMVVNGTDAPVEDVDPIASFYASVTRKRTDNGMEFFTAQKMNREEALRSYTINAAYAAFEEEKKGSLEIGKYADIVILDKNLQTCSDEEILDCNVLYTIVDGKIKYQSNN